MMEEYAGQVVIDIQGLTKHYGQLVAVDELKLAVQRDDIFGFVGPNGAGKTTTIRMLAGLVLPTDGDATILGHSIRDDLHGALRKTGVMIETSAFYPHLSGCDNLHVISHLLGKGSERFIQEALELVDLARDAHRPYKDYSMGMKRRLDFAAVLLHEPDVLILDEPTRGLDPLGTQWVHKVLRDLANEGKTIFFSSHSLHDVERLCNRVALIHQGSLIFEDTITNLLQRCSAVRMRFTDPVVARAVVATIENIPLLSIDGDTFVVDTSQTDVETLLETLAQHSLYPVEVGAHESLEHLFLELVEKEEDKR